MEVKTVTWVNLCQNNNVYITRKSLSNCALEPRMSNDNSGDHYGQDRRCFIIHSMYYQYQLTFSMFLHRSWKPGRTSMLAWLWIKVHLEILKFSGSPWLEWRQTEDGNTVCRVNNWVWNQAKPNAYVESSNTLNFSYSMKRSVLDIPCTLCTYLQSNLKISLE